MKRVMIGAVIIGIISVATAGVTINIYEPDGLTPFDGRNIIVGKELKLVVVSDANDFWSGGLFISGSNRNLGILSGAGKDPNSRDHCDSHLESAGQYAWVTRWEDSVIEGFDLFSDSNCTPGDWFEISYTALAPGDPNVGFYEYSVSWDDPNAFVTFHQVPSADFDTDGIVNLSDYSLLASCWLENNFTGDNSCISADLDEDGIVDINDLILFSDYWLWGIPEPNEPNQVEPLADLNLIYRIVDANGLDEISIDVGQTVTLYVDMVTHDVNEVWFFEIEADLSDTNLGMIDNTAYDPNNPPGAGTARILADPNRWAMFDNWGPGQQQQEGIYLSGLSLDTAFEDGHLASFEFTCQGEGDVMLSLINWSTLSMSGQKLYPALEGILIHQNNTVAESMLMMPSSMSMMSTASMEVAEESAVDIEEMVQFLEDIWLENKDIQKTIPEEDWQEFIKSVEQSY